MTRSRPMKVIVRTQAKKNRKKSPSKPTAVGQLIRTLAGAGGGYLGGLVGAPTLGGAAGTQLGAMASKWLGFGDYKVNVNSVMSKAADSVPYMHKSDQAIMLRHREFVGTVTSTQAFTVQYELPLNPGMTTFPWLSQIASRFQEYRFKGVVFHYIPASGSAISDTNSALGTVMLQTTYRPSDTKPTSKIEMLNEYCANEVVPSESAIHPIECDPKQNPFAVQYVRAIPVPSSESVLNYDLGKTFIATQGQQGDGNYLGDVWVTYEVELSKPVFSSNIVQNPVTTATFSGATTSNYFTTQTASDDTLGLTFSGRTITFPANGGTRFIVTCHYGDSNISATSSWVAPTTDNGVIDFTKHVNVVSGSSQLMHTTSFTKTDFTKPAVLTLPSATLTGTLNLCSAIITRAW